MSITPSGVYKRQVSQGGLKNQSIFDSDFFSKVALRDPDASEPASVGMPSDDVNGIDTDLQEAMNQSNSQSLQTVTDPSNPQADFALIANEITKFLSSSKALRGSYVLTNQQVKQQTGIFTFTIEPADRPMMNGPMVTKGQ